MRKFRHKATGQIATETHSEKNYKVSYPKNFTVPKWIVENSNDWDEVKETIRECADDSKPKYSLNNVRQALRWVDNKQAKLALLVLKSLSK